MWPRWPPRPNPRHWPRSSRPCRTRKTRRRARPADRSWCGPAPATSARTAELRAAAHKRANKKHPFGFGKALFSWTLLSAFVMLIFGAGLSFYFGLRRFLVPEDIRHIALAIATLCISILTNGYGVSVSARRLLDGRPLNELKDVFISSTNLRRAGLATAGWHRDVTNTATSPTARR